MGTDAPERYGDALFAKDRPDEHARLGALADAFDPVSRLHLAALGPGPGWRCLDAGTGRGSVAGWLAGRVEPGEVVAMDTDTRLLAADIRARPTIRVLTADLTDPGLHPGEFDLIHARFVLMHLRQRFSVLGRLVSWLRPGGRLVLSDYVDMTTATSAHRAWAAVMGAMWQTLRASIGSEIDWVPAYPTLLSAAGLVDIGAGVHLPSADPSAPITTFWRLTLARMRDRIAADGQVTAADVDAVVAMLGSPGFTELSPGMFTVWGRRPPS